MKKRAYVKVTDFARLDAWPLAAARGAAETLQSSIRPCGAGQSAVRGSGAQFGAGGGIRTLMPHAGTPDFKSGASDQFRHPGPPRRIASPSARYEPGCSALRG